MHLFAFGTLYVSAIMLISLWFQYVNIKFPDPLQPYYSYGYDELRVPMAALIVVFPVFFLLARWISREITREPERKELRIYKWLVYLTLFVSATTIVIDLITLIYNFLGGELTSRIGLKILVVLIVALGVFGYYFWHLRSDLAQTADKRTVLLWITVLVVLGSIVAGFFIVGSPSTARTRRYDQQRVSNLQDIQWQVINYWQLKEKLPATLADLRNDITEYQVPVDPRTKVSYEYRALGALQFELCATFEEKGSGTSGPYPMYSDVMPMPPMGDGKLDSWNHDMGRACFTRTIDPDLYPKPTR